MADAGAHSDAIQRKLTRKGAKVRWTMMIADSKRMARIEVDCFAGRTNECGKTDEMSRKRW